MLSIYLIRHAKTYGNTLGRYIGTTDEPLCEEGIRQLKQGTYPLVDLVYASPMKRCLETARLIYPGCQIIFNEKLRECSFGEFENRNYKELGQNPRYQAWVDGGGRSDFPGGESRESFKARCCQGFWEVLEDALKRRAGTIALVVHGGTIMSILEAYAISKEPFYHWQARNGMGYRADVRFHKTENKGERILYEIDHFSPICGLSS